jgi:uncharacterized protein with NRDE domain
MCTLIVLHRCFPEAPLLIAANRDEYLERPAEPPGLRRIRGRGVVAPRDLRAGGTWLGVNDRRVFVAVTNRPTPRPDPARRSRGLLVEDLLASASAREAAGAAARVAPGAYNPFHLFVGDGDEAFAAVYDGAPDVAELGAGAHVVGNADPDDRRVPKIARLLGEAERVAAGRLEDAFGALAALCRVHGAGADPRDDTCIHAGTYGTRSSALLRLGGAGGAFWYADGPPCRTPYEDLTPLLRGLGADAASLQDGTATRTVA